MKKISPDWIIPGFRNSLMIEKAVTLFPHPDSPTMATVSLLSIKNERCRTAKNSSSAGAGNVTERFLTVRSRDALMENGAVDMAAL